MQNRNSTSCTRLTTYDGCSSDTMVPSFTLLPTIQATSSTTVTATSLNTWSVAADKTINKAFTFPATNQIASKSGTTTCTCTNVPKEIHYIAYTSGGSQITSISANVVFEATISGT
mmetsp:Transcript_35480/g.35137  ORF Transcript_35480/g.35137 Transcript_35480/m.35137 type:complete len:116 (+) Transcript_35480:128-475(+)